MLCAVCGGTGLIVAAFKMDKRLAERRANFKKNFEDPRRKREDLQVINLNPNIKP